jgi:hypothetical protein
MVNLSNLLNLAFNSGQDGVQSLQNVGDELTSRISSVFNSAQRSLNSLRNETDLSLPSNISPLRAVQFIGVTVLFSVLAYGVFRICQYSSSNGDSSDSDLGRDEQGSTGTQVDGGEQESPDSLPRPNSISDFRQPFIGPAHLTRSLSTEGFVVPGLSNNNDIEHSALNEATRVKIREGRIGNLTHGDARNSALNEAARVEIREGRIGNLTHGDARNSALNEATRVGIREDRIGNLRHVHGDARNSALNEAARAGIREFNLGSLQPGHEEQVLPNTSLRRSNSLLNFTLPFIDPVHLTHSPSTGNLVVPILNGSTSAGELVTANSTLIIRDGDRISVNESGTSLEGSWQGVIGGSETGTLHHSFSAPSLHASGAEESRSGELQRVGSDPVIRDVEISEGSPHRFQGPESILKSYPKWKQDQYKFIVEEIKYSILSKYQLSTEDSSVIVERLKSVISGVKNKDIKRRLDNLIDRLFSGERQIDSYSLRNYYQYNLGRIDSESLAQEPHEIINFVDVLVQSCIGACLSDQFDDVVHKVLRSERSQEQIMPKVSSRLLQGFETIKKSSLSKFPSTETKYSKLQGQIGVLGFNPNSFTNYFSILWQERYVNDSNEEVVIDVYRFGTPTEDFLASSDVLGFFSHWLDGLDRSGKCHCYFGHQKTKDTVGWGDREAERTDALIKIGEKKSAFFMINLPLDGLIFNQKSEVLKEEFVSYQDFSSEVFQAIFSSANGFYFPRDKLLSKGVDLSEVVDLCMNETRGLFEHADMSSLTKEQRQNFLLIFYAKLEQRLCVALKASRNSTCKDAIDRGGIVNAITYYLGQRSCGFFESGKTPRCNSRALEDLETVLHHGALFVKGQAVIKSRYEPFIKAIEFLEKISTLKDVANVSSFKMQKIALLESPLANFRRSQLEVDILEFKRRLPGLIGNKVSEEKGEDLRLEILDEDFTETKESVSLDATTSELLKESFKLFNEITLVNAGDTTTLSRVFSKETEQDFFGRELMPFGINSTGVQNLLNYLSPEFLADKLMKSVGNEFEHTDSFTQDRVFASQDDRGYVFEIEQENGFLKARIKADFTLFNEVSNEAVPPYELGCVRNALLTACVPVDENGSLNKEALVITYSRNFTLEA